MILLFLDISLPTFIPFYIYIYIWEGICNIVDDTPKNMV